MSQNMQDESEAKAARTKLVRSLSKEVCHHPERMGAELRRRHRNTADLSQRHYYMYALDFLTEAMNEQQHPELEKRLDAIFDSGAPQALLDIALDRQTYAYMHVDAMSTEYVLGTYTCLSRLVCHAVKAHCGYAHVAGKHAPWATELLQEFPKLWPLLLQLRDLVTHGSDDFGRITLAADSQEAERSTKFRKLIYELLHAHKELCKVETDQPPSLRSDMGLVVLLLSTCASYAPELHNLSLVIFFETICLPADDIIPFLDRAIACRALIPARFICNLRNTFLDEKLVDAKLLSVLISSHEVFNHPALASARGAGCHFSLVLLSAAQRQVCSGTAEEQTWEILRLTFLHIMDIFTQDPDVFSSDMDMGMVTREYYHYLILLAARALRPAAMDTLDRIDSLNNVMIILTTSAQLITEDPEFPPELNLAFRTSVHQVWNRAHDGLAAISRAEAPQKWKVLKWWRDFGSQCGVDLDAPYVPPTPAVGDEAWTKDMGCAWRECLCFGERPDHALRKCKRCERVLYCSKKCQTQDWNQGGHKQVCRRVAS